MENQQKDIIDRMNRKGGKGQPFAFLIDFDFQKPILFDLDNSRDIIQWATPIHSNIQKKDFSEKQAEWQMQTISKERYQTAFELVQQHINNGNTYLLNLTFPSRISTNLELEEIFQKSKALYKVFLKDQFVCFSPEIFVRIENGIISSYPMKGTIDAKINNAEVILKNDRKELAEHNTIVDLIRNDLSLVANNVTVEKFRYIDRLKTNRGELLQMSSKICGQLPGNYQSQIGTIVAKMLPAGSICGAPKKKTVEIIKEAEQYDRGYYTGVFGIFDGQNLDSCVLIRYLEKDGGQLVFKSGGGITFLSKCDSEYDELINKVYVPIT